MDWNDFRHHLKGSGLNNTEISKLYKKYKSDVSDLRIVRKNGLLSPRRTLNNEKYITNAEDLDAFAKSIGNYKTRKAPGEKAKLFTVGDTRVGMDGNKWTITKTKNGVKRWTRVRSSNTLQNGKDELNETLISASPDIIIKMAESMENEDILSLCKSNKKFDKILCQNMSFWDKRYEKEFGKKIKHNASKEIFLESIKWNKHIVSALDFLLNFSNLNFEKQKKYYNDFVREMKKEIKILNISDEIKRIKGAFDEYTANDEVDDWYIELDWLESLVKKGYTYFIEDEFDDSMDNLMLKYAKLNPILRDMTSLKKTLYFTYKNTLGDKFSVRAHIADGYGEIVGKKIYTYDMFRITI